ncbi:ABC-type transport auxiliary lipoprotein family protein [Sphingomonas sp.]|uniref:ABC-type transport auxiliary lipoprotein family protein n=1 Tax=Sphingomonas sp. TaxID=28214 RepID=UPI0035A97A12
MMLRSLIRPLALVAMAPLAGCISLAGKPPAMLLTLASSASPAAGVTLDSRTARTIALQTPVTPAAIAGPRVPVMTGATSIAYVKGAVWAEPPARLFVRVLADTLAAQAGRVVLSPQNSFGDGGARLSGELRTFGVDAATDQAVVVFEAVLVRDGQKTIEKRRFEAREPMPVVTAAAAGLALNRAANRVAADIAAWVGR